MVDFNISQFAQKVQDFINENKIDKNGDKKINESNGELAALLSGMGAESVDELLMGDSVQFGNTRPPQKVLGPSKEEIETLENIAKAKEKYQDLSADQQQTVRENTIKILEEKWNKLYHTPGIGIIQNLDYLTGNPHVELLINLLKGMDAEGLQEEISKITDSVSSSVADATSKYNMAFKEYDFMYRDFYTTTRDNDDSEFEIETNKLGGGYTIAAKVRDAGDKFKQQVLEKFAEGSLTPEELLAAYNKYNNTVIDACSEIRKITDLLTAKYEEEALDDSAALYTNTLNSEGFVDIKGNATLTSFTDAVNNLEDSGVGSPKAEQENNGPKKYMENGRIVIERNGEKYDLSGRRIE